MIDDLENIDEDTPKQYQEKLVNKLQFGSFLTTSEP
jgi:hypothetical protein